MMNPAMLLNAPSDLQATSKAGNIDGTTKRKEASRTAFKPCFFYAQNLWLAVSNTVAKGVKNRIRIFNAGGLIGRNKRPFSGNTSSRLCAVVETRPPVKNAGGQTLTKRKGGLPMANTSQAPTIGQFSFTIQLPADSYINSLIANYSCNTWQLWIETTKGQTRPILNAHDQSIKDFETLDSLAFWLGAQGFSKMAVYLPESKTQPAGSDLTGGAE